MALFETMRENTKVILWITVIAFVALIFLAWGANFTSQRSKRGAEAGVLARVNGVPILETDFDATLEQARATYEEQTGKQPDDNFFLRLQASTWDQLVDRALIRKEAERRGVSTTEREISIAMLQNPLPRFQGNPSFRDEQGKFDIQRYQAWLADPQTNTLPLEREYSELILQEKLRMQVLAGVIVSESEVHQAWADQNERVDIAFAMIPFARVTVPENVDDAALEAYLREHAADFHLPEQVALDYVKMPKQPTSTDSIQASSEIEEAYNAFRHGEDFTTLVQSYSQAPPERWGGEKAPYLERGALGGGKVADAAFTLPVGETSSILVEPDGFHVVKVEDRKNENGVDKVRIAEIYIPLKISYDTNQALRERAVALADSTAASGFAAAAEAQGLKVAQTGFFSPEGFIPGLGRLEAAQEFARIGRAQTNSKPIETADAWFVLHLTDRRAARDATLEDVRPRVRAAYLLEQRKQMARTAAEALLARAQAGTPLETVAQGNPLATYQAAPGVTRQGPIPGVGRDANLTAAVFAASGIGLVPRVVVGNQGAFVVTVQARSPLDETAYAAQKDQVRSRLLRDRQNRAASEWMRQMRESAEIQDYRQVVAAS
jgi:peptidyl-prolyl cis-trans isomerase D